MAEKPTIVENNRGRQVSRLGDKTKSVSVGLMDMDSAIFYYFENVIKPYIEENGEQVKVPIIYANPERWAAVQKQGFVRDQKKKVMAPIIAFRRTGFQKDTTIPVDKIDPMDPKLHLHYESQYSKANRYDKLTALRGLTPKKEIFSVAVPDYVELSYDFIIWTNFTDHMNHIVEKINWSEGSYWGDPGKFRFRTKIDNYSDASEYEGSTRKIKTTFSLTLNGYLLPDEYPPTAVNTEKFITPKQIVLNDSTDINISAIAGVDEDGAKTVTVINNIAKGGGGGGGSVQPLTIEAGQNMSFNTLVFGGSDAETITIAGSSTPTFTIVSGSVFSGSFVGDGSLLTGMTSGIFQLTGSSQNTTSDIEITGSAKVISSATSSTAIFTNNIQNGYPTSNNWGQSLDGSYFNNFDNTTHVSEILRFMAGVISHSLDVADASPNTKTYGSVTATYSDGTESSKNTLFNGVLGSTYENARLSTSWTGSAYVDLTETASYRAVLDYLEHKNWVQSSDRGTNNDDAGTNPFHGSYASRIPSSNITTQGTFGTFSHTLSGNAAGSTLVSSNSNYFGLGSLTSGGATEYKVRVIATQSFSDAYDDQTPDENSTFTTSSVADYTTTSFGTSGDGLILAKIDTAQPAVIPAAYQDGDFTSVVGAVSARKYTAGATAANNISASGYYAYHGVKAGIATGSQSDFVYNNGSNSSTRFYIYTGDIPTDITTGAPTAGVDSAASQSAFSATSRSLSGAPYLLTTSYSYKFNSEVSKSFDPGFGYASNILVNSLTTDTWDNVGSTSLSNATTTVANTGVSSTGATNYVIDSTITTKRNSGETPDIDDVAVASSSFSFSLDSNSTNVVQNRSGNSSLNYNLKFRATGRNWKNSSATDDSSTISFYDASLFGQDSDSGSMAIYSRAQGYDSNTLQDTTETFTGEDFRIVIADNVTAFNGAYFTTDSFQTNDEGDAVLGNYDLQVKPNYLVDPGGNYGYWFPSNFGSGTYKYYIRRFQASSGTKTSMTVNVGKTLVNWNSTSDGVAVGLILKSGTSAGGNTSISTCRIYDPSATTSNLIEGGVSSDNHKNPFSSNIDLYGNTGGSISSTTYTLPLRNADGMFIDNTDNELYVIIRYKSDPSPVTSITLSYS